MRLVRKVGVSVAFVVGVALVGFGVPLIWLLIAAELQGAAGITSMTKTTAVAVYPGVVISYLALMYLIGWVLSRKSEGTRAPPPRVQQPWLRSLGDERAKPERPTGLEMFFITAALAVSIAFTLWFFLWAGPPI